jgi:HTH-type transcriptional regulator, competence development regulator
MSREKRFGDVIRSRREELKITLRKFAALVDMSPTYLSKVERSEFPPPAEKKILAIATNLQLDPDELLALAGRIASDVTDIIQKQPTEMASFLRAAEHLPKGELERIMRQIQRRHRE